MAIKQMDIVIVGGGVAGLSLAILLAEAGLRVCLAEPHPPSSLKDTKLSGRTVALMNSSVNILKACDVWTALEPHSAPLQAMRIIDDSVSTREPIEIDFPAQDIGQPQFGFNIPNAALRAALYERAQKIKTLQIINSGFTRFETTPGGVSVMLEDKTTLSAKLIIGADGRASPVRKQAGIATTEHPYGQSAITCVINHSRSHNNISTEFHRPSGPFALVPLPGNRSSVVWVEKTDRADALLKLKKQDFTQALEDATAGILGGITLETNPECWPLCAIKAKSMTAARLALLAEAAHVMSPITAQGLNLSLRDVAALAELIVDAARLGLDIGASNILENFEKRRRLDIETRVFGVDGMNRIVSTDQETLKDLRRFGLKTLDNVSPLKTLAMQIGLAPELDNGRLVRGEAL
jgi:2-octaprenyl-6-methoxyphenol hydroxylase